MHTNVRCKNWRKEEKAKDQELKNVGHGENEINSYSSKSLKFMDITCPITIHSSEDMQYLILTNCGKVFSSSMMRQPDRWSEWIWNSFALHICIQMTMKDNFHEFGLIRKVHKINNTVVRNICYSWMLIEFLSER
jgi:hypothetical protein